MAYNEEAIDSMEVVQHCLNCKKPVCNGCMTTIRVSKRRRVNSGSFKRRQFTDEELKLICNSGLKIRELTVMFKMSSRTVLQLREEYRKKVDYAKGN